MTLCTSDDTRLCFPVPLSSDGVSMGGDGVARADTGGERRARMRINRGHIVHLDRALTATEKAPGPASRPGMSGFNGKTETEIASARGTKAGDC